MYPGHVLAFGVGGLEQVDDLFKVQFGAVDYLLRTMTFQYRGWHQRAGINDHRATANQPLALDGNQFGVAGTCANEVDGHRRFLWEKGAEQAFR
ncbi:hypothetical protein D9M71_419260 [compost metagenome]